MTSQDNGVPEWRLHRTADEIRHAAKRVMFIGGILIGVGVVTIVMSYASTASSVLLPVAIVAMVGGGGVLLRGTHRWVRAYQSAERQLTAPVP